MGMQALRRIQIGLESTRGTLVAADTILLGALQYTDQRTFHQPEDEERNSLALVHRSTELTKATSLAYTGALTFEQALQFLSMGIKGDISPSTPTNGVLTRDWTFLPSLTADNDQDSFTVEYGDDQQEYECGHVMAEQLEFAFAMGEVAQLSATLFGQSTAKNTFTGGLSVPTVEDVVSQTLKYYRDSAWANLGDTEKSGTVANAVIRVPTGLTMVRYADGTTEFSTYGAQKRAAEVELTVRHNAEGEALYDAYVAQTLMFIRLEATGSLIESVTPDYNKLFRFDGAIRLSEPPQFFEDYNGHNTVVLRGRTFHDPTSDNDMSFMVRNKETAI
jgi:hypothetical protein